MFQWNILSFMRGRALGRIGNEWALLLLRRVRTFDAGLLPGGWPCLLGHSAAAREAAQRVLRNWQCSAADA